MSRRTASTTGLALAAALAFCCILAPSAAAAIDIAGFELAASNEGGSPAIQAGSHPWQLTTRVELADPALEGGLRDLHISLPPGLIENPQALPYCSAAQFSVPRVSPFEASQSGESCPEKTQVGVITLQSGLGGIRSFGLFNLPPTPGSPSRLGASPFGIPLTFTSHIRQTRGEYSIVLDLLEAPQDLGLESFTTRLWGTPWSLTHNTERGSCLNEADPEDPWGKCSVGRPAFNPAEAFLTLPASCTGPLQSTATADSWAERGAYLPDGEPDPADPAWERRSASPGPPLVGCDLLHFTPVAQGQLTTDRAASPTGFDLIFDIEEQGLLNPKLTESSQPQRAVVSLAEGMTLNPSLAAGLGVCTPAQYEAETVSSAPGAGCPNGSKIGDLSVTSPLYEKTIQGSIFLAEPDDPASAAPGAENPFDSLLAVYLVARSSARGVIVKLPGRLDPDPASGRLTATFEDLPQLPYAHFRVHFREGQRSPLLSPPSCGTYNTSIDLQPWLSTNATIQETSPFTIAHGLEGGPCPGGSAPPFTPAALGGTLNSQAGAYSPFYLHLTRTDSEQEITSYSAELPPGLLGNLSGVPFCPDAAIAAAAARSGRAEEREPSCPAASSIGHTYSGYGVGPVLAYAPGGLYLAGPFHGAPLSIVAIDSATVGPFDLGVIVVRSAIRIDPSSARVSIDSAASTPIPHILAGIPLHLRDVRVYVNRPGFTVNPTSCDPFSLSSTLTGSAPPYASPLDSRSSPAVRFQVADCSALGFAPKLSLRLKGGTRRGEYPSLRAVLTARPGDANLAAARVSLPSSEFLAQEHIDSVCTAAAFEAESCPRGSRVGTATALTPLLSEPMQGAAYLRASKQHLLPDLGVVLHGRGVRIILSGHIDTTKEGGLRGSFESLPDAPLTRFALRLFGGSRGILVNGRENICRSPHYATARLLGQANLGAISHPRVQTDCKKKQRKRRSKGGKR
jgi:hypothetical protein